ncbi:hypothetical protein C9374_010108 [Naegleria lovaniensis]|uniref:Rho GTPase activating protein n=1 Tax=Naegleria lovaniensis TaxID=51637 RepID=A0AA88GIB9_NAELO|nr:uncharacterized protein C9374_010108 [Naegleria lovaniensis]KAG2375104.1 hypothetical protein C9374_010108 [Naegleria lovaniensis]
MSSTPPSKKNDHDDIDNGMVMTTTTPQPPPSTPTPTHVHVHQTTSSNTPIVDAAIVQSDDGVWLTIYDPQTKRHYYHNKSTGETTWSLPMNLSSPNLNTTLNVSTKLHENLSSSKTPISPVVEMTGKTPTSMTPKTPTAAHKDESLILLNSEQPKRRPSSHNNGTPSGHQRSLSQDNVISNLKSRLSHLHAIPINVKKEIETHSPSTVANLDVIGSVPASSGLFTRSQYNSDDEEDLEEEEGDIKNDEIETPRQQQATLNVDLIKNLSEENETEKPLSTCNVQLGTSSNSSVSTNHTNNASNVTTPSVSSPQISTQSLVSSLELEDGWETAVDANTGRTYYFHRQSQKSTWEPPYKNKKVTHYHTPSTIENIADYKLGGEAETNQSPNHVVNQSSSPHVQRPKSTHLTSSGMEDHSQDTSSDSLPRITQGEHTLSKYGATHFQKFKKGLFKKQVKVEKLIEFQKDRLNQTLQPIKMEQHQEKALRCFELVQLFMGDRAFDKCSPTVKQVVKSGTNVHDFFLSKEILQIALLNVPIRNEIIIYLCKQTNNNPKADSAVKGLQLLGLMLSAFPPTSYDLQEAVLHFLQHTIVTHPKLGKDERIRQFSLLSEKHLRRSCVTGPRKTLPSDNEIKNMSNPHPPEPIFGVSIVDYLKWQKEKFPQFDPSKPYILYILSEALKKVNFSSVEGIFRLPGDVSRVEALKDKFCKCNFEIGEKDPHVLASLFKLWLRELADPLIPHRLYEHCVAVANSEQESAAVLDQLPHGNRAILSFVLDFLSDMLPNCKKTMMTSENLAVVFCPNILRSQSSDPMAIMRNAASEKQFVRNLILKVARQKGISEK